MIFLVLLMFCRVLFLLSIILPLPEELPLMCISGPGNKQWILHFLGMGKIQIISSFLNDIFTGWNSGFDSFFFPNTLKVLSLFCRFHRFWKQVSWNYSLLFLSMKLPLKNSVCLFYFSPIFRLAVVWIYDMFRHEGFFLFFFVSLVELIPLDVLWVPWNYGLASTLIWKILKLLLLKFLLSYLTSVLCLGL